MSEWLLVLTPIIILLIVLQLGGGCAFSGTGPVGPSQSYPDTATGISGLVAFWNLDETSGTIAKDSQGVDATHPNGGNPGTYIQPPQLFYNGGDKSAAAPGTLSQGGQSLSSNGGGPAVSFNGGYVEVPFNAALNPANAPGFSIALGVSPGWDPDPAQPAIRVTLESGQVVGATATVGFVLRSNAQNQWEFAIGNGSATDVVVTGDPVTAKNATNYVVATYDGTAKTLSLSVDGGDPATAAASPVYQPNTIYPLRIAMGAGRVTPPTSTEPKVEFPFNGRISGVLLFNRPLTSDETNTLSLAFLASA